MIKKTFWKNKKILITGHTGFKGSWLILLLKIFGAKIYGYSLKPPTEPSMFNILNLTKVLVKDYRLDVKKIVKFKEVLNRVNPEIIFHLAAQPSVPDSYKNPLDTFETNTLGTLNVLEAARTCKTVKSIIIVTTDKVYKNLKINKKFKETSELGGKDIYSSSKACAEILTNSYVNSFYQNIDCNIATVRAGNCVGGGDWTKDRLIKDCVESFLKNKNLFLRMPKATRPWQHVLEPLLGYIVLAEKLYLSKKYRGAWNFGPSKKNNLSVFKVANFGRSFFKTNSKIIKSKKKFFETTHLSLDNKKSRKQLGWDTVLDPNKTLWMTFSWYKLFFETKDYKKILSFTNQQIQDYLIKIKIKKN